MPQPDTIREAIQECFRSHGGQELQVQVVAAWIDQHYPGRWKDVATSMADLTISGHTSSTYRDSDKYLIRVSTGVDRLSDSHRM